MRNLLLAILVLSCPVLAFGQLHEILRPTADADGAGNALGLCIGAAKGSAAAGNAYDGAGLSTSVTEPVTALASETSGRFISRIFSTWASATQTYTALSINVNSSSTGPTTLSALGDSYVVYSINSGTNWTVLHQDQNSTGWAQVTDTAALSASQNLTTVKVAVCIDTSGDTVHTGADQVILWDIWTDGTYTPPGMGKRVFRTSLSAPGQSRQVCFIFRQPAIFRKDRRAKERWSQCRG
jgi:hypothetical protein